MHGLKQLVNTPDIYEAFLKTLEARISALHKSLEQTTKPEDIYRLQGQITSFRRLLVLREEVNSNQAG